MFINNQCNVCITCKLFWYINTLMNMYIKARQIFKFNRPTQIGRKCLKQFDTSKLDDKKIPNSYVHYIDNIKFFSG